MAVCTTGTEWATESTYFSRPTIQIIQAIFRREIKFRDGSGIAKAGEGNQAFAPLNRMTYKQVDAEGGTTGPRTRVAATESVTFCVPIKNRLRFVEFESASSACGRNA